MPVRIQRKRSRGWKMPPNTVYVGRPSRWGNPFQLGAGITRTGCVNMFRHYLDADMLAISKDQVRAALRGKNLACWCPLDQPCHADVLLNLANSEEV